MTDVNPDPDESYDPTQDYGEYNPESIDWNNQDNEPPQEKQSPKDNANEQAYDPGYVEQPVDPASKSPTSFRSQNEPEESHDAAPSVLPGNDQTSVTSDETIKPTTAGVNDNVSNVHPPATQEVSQEPSVLPKSVDLQALLAGLVPARSKATSHSPPEPRPVAAAPTQPYHPAPAMNLPQDILYHLQNATSPPPQQAQAQAQAQAQFQPPPQQYQSQLPPQTGPVDIQPQDLALTPPEERLYEKFLDNEREVVQHARWDEFAPGSRMFIGNLPTDKIGKRDVFRLFYPYGRLAQISIKQAYGFVQFYDKEDCENAIRAQQGMYLTGRKVHLEISKPQKPKDGDAGKGRQQRNRSPFGRDRSPGPGRGRGRGRARGGHEDFEGRGRQPMRERSPPGRYGRDEDYGRRYSRSRSPPAGRFPGSPRDRPPPSEVALLVKDDPDRYNSSYTSADERGYVHHVEDMFNDKRIRTEIIFVSPRASIPDITRQMVVDGALAVISLTRQLQERRKITMQTFQRNPNDPGAIKWDEYNEIDIPVAVDLVLAMKTASLPVQQPAFPVFPPQQFPQQQFPLQQSAPPGGVNPNLANIIGSMGPAALQKVFGAIAQQPIATPQYHGYNQPPNQGLAGLLGQNPALGGYGMQPPRAAQAGPPAQQVQDIMAQLTALSKKPS
jgi:nuclear polyadenylated RNA-binding protein 3